MGVVETIEAGIIERIRDGKFKGKDYAATTRYMRNVIGKVCRENGFVLNEPAIKDAIQRGIQLVERGGNALDPEADDANVKDVGFGFDSAKVQALLDSLAGILPVIEFGLACCTGAQEEDWKKAVASFDAALADLAE